MTKLERMAGIGNNIPSILRKKNETLVIVFKHASNIIESTSQDAKLCKELRHRASQWSQIV